MFANARQARSGRINAICFFHPPSRRVVMSRAGYGLADRVDYSLLDLGDTRRIALMITPRGRGTFVAQAHEVLTVQQSILNTWPDPARVTVQTVFLREAALQAECERIFANHYGARMPVTNYVVQPPCCGAALAVGPPRHQARLADRFDLELNEPPDGIIIRNVSPSDWGAKIVLQSDAEKTKPGLEGNLIINVVPGKNLATSEKGKKPGTQRRAAIGTLPAIPFEIVGQQQMQEDQR